ncbi:ShlB/FhaC/HecB family hemolysin secretion/activation protein [Undibacterium parvum]|uniref:ShlB/FhaC/HecB family hemolysin secretion/activation protein n=2 Tax=Undibacterium TaxID=401469 RepID=A0A6M4A9I6_9BURK|nr:ShlB/FhaC/HecB family hemolysin secretion/activation protein [Undibacterium parvum]QJQ07430.1 ShlB/FhaC/HecB family hemolysin secretion/activation protein [Undibacterium piscinae]
MKTDNSFAMKINSKIPFCKQYVGSSRAVKSTFFCTLLALAMLPVQAQEKPAAALVKSADNLPIFNIFEYKIDGNSRLTDQQVERAVLPYMGEQKTLAEVESARASLERAYHDAGYLTVLVSIPEQNVDTGVVELLVLEATVERLRVKGSEYHTLTGIKAAVPELAEGNVPNFTQMQLELAAVNRSADLKATPVLRAGKAPGTVEVQLDVEDQLPLHGNLDLSNRQSPNTSAMRLAASLRYDNLWQRAHSLGVTAQTSPQKPDEVRVLASTYVAPVSDDGAALTAYWVHSRSTLTTLANAPGLGVLGNSDILGLRYALPSKSLNDYAYTLAAGTDYKNVKQSVAVHGAGAVTTPITYMPLVATYTGSWLSDNHPTTLDATATVGLRGVFGNTDQEFSAKRAGASANYIALRSGVLHVEKFGGWSLSSKAEVQFASGPLVSNEQYTGGGADNVRGYLEGELAGDEALRLSFELRTPSYKPAGETSVWSLTGLSFFDAVRLRTLDVLPPQSSIKQLRGVGMGLRLLAPRGFALELDWAHALNDADVTKAGSNRLHARLLWEY